MQKDSLPYIEGTSLEYIIEDGWSRHYPLEQTLSEATQMGYSVTKEMIMEKWLVLDAQMEAWLASRNQLVPGPGSGE